MQKPRIEIKPSNLNLGDLITPQASVEPAKQYKGQRRIFRISDGLIAFLSLKPVFTTSGSTVWNVKFLMQTGPDEFIVFEPSYERFDGTGVSVDGIFAGPLDDPPAATILRSSVA
jgi:hypothetical protein